MLHEIVSDLKEEAIKTEHVYLNENIQREEK